MLWLAALQLLESGDPPQHLRPPKWRHPKPCAPAPGLHTGELVRALRCELWAPQLSPESFSHFMSSPPVDANAQKPEPSLPHLLFAAA